MRETPPPATDSLNIPATPVVDLETHMEIKSLPRDADLSAVPSHPAVIVSVVVAAIALTACALVAIAYMLGWVPLNAAGPPGAIAAPGQQVTGSAPGVVLPPRQTLIGNPDSGQAAAPRSAPPSAI